MKNLKPAHTRSPEQQHKPPVISVWLLFTFALFALVSCGQSSGQQNGPTAEQATKPAGEQVAKSVATQPQSIAGDLFVELINKLTNAVEKVTLESLNGTKDPEVVRKFVKSSLDFFQEKKPSPEQMAVARAKAFESVWFSILLYAQSVPTVEADGYRATAPKFMKICEELAGDKDAAQEALRFAVVGGHTGIVAWLAEHGANVNVKAHNGVTPLIFATAQGDANMVETLLKAGADANVQGLNDRTALMFAADGGRNNIVKLLLTKGADPSIKTKEGQTALSLAKLGDRLETIALLRDAGAKD